MPGATQNKKINEFEFSQDVQKILTTVQLAYKKAPYFNDVYSLVERVLTQKDRTITMLCKASIEMVFDYLGINKQFYISSELDCKKDLPAAERLIEISKLLDCEQYINSPGGMKLYNKHFFSAHNVELSFIEMDSISYKQNCTKFVPYLSMIDVLMWNSNEQVIELLTKYRLA